MYCYCLLHYQVTLAYLKHKWHSGQRQDAFDLLGRFVHVLQPEGLGEQLTTETNQLLARYVNCNEIHVHPFTYLHQRLSICLWGYNAQMLLFRFLDISEVVDFPLNIVYKYLYF